MIKRTIGARLRELIMRAEPRSTVRPEATRSLVAAMVAILLTQAVYVAPVVAAPASIPELPTAPAPDAKPAVDDQPITLDPEDEVPALRTASSMTYDLGHGKYAVEAFADPVFYQPDGSEAWEPIDLEFTTDKRGTIAKVVEAPVRVEVGAKGDGLIELAFEDYRIALRPIATTLAADESKTHEPTDTPAATTPAAEQPAADDQAAEAPESLAPAVDGEPETPPVDAEPVELDPTAMEAALAEPVAAEAPTAENQRADIVDVLPGVDLRVFAHADGTSNFLVLDAVPQVAAWTFAVSSEGLRLVAGEGGGLDFVDQAGTKVATMPAPYAVDSTPDERTGGGRITTAAWYTLSEVDGVQLVTVSVDAGWLESAVYPVYVDPSVTVYTDGTASWGDTFVNAGNPTMSYANYQRPDSPYAYELWLGESPSDSTYFNMDYIKVDLGDQAGNIVDDASLEVRPYHQYYDAPTSTRTWLRRVVDPWTENINWTSKPDVTANGLTFADCVEGAQCAFDVTSFASNWLDGDWVNYGVRLDEIDPTNTWKGPTFWKRLISAEQGTNTRPRIILTYHNPVAVTYPSGGPTGGRTLSWTNEAAWSQNAYHVDLSTQADFSSILETSGDVVDTSSRSWAIPTTRTLTPGQTYHWRVKARRTTVQSTNQWSAWATGSFTWNPDVNLGLLGSNTYESFDLGSGDSLSVNVSTGNPVLSHPVVDLPIRGGSLPIGLTYNGFDQVDAGLGAGWRLSLQRSISFSGTEATFTDADGARHVFTGASTAGSVTTWTRPATLYATLRSDTAQAGQEITLTYRDRSKDTFRASDGRLVRSEDRFGNAVTYGYSGSTDTVTDPAGRTVSLAWGTVAGKSRLIAITDWAVVDGSGIVQGSGTPNRTHRFFYDTAGTLLGWADALNTTAIAACPSTSHTTCLGYTTGRLTSVAKYQTYTTISGASLGTGNRFATTTIAYRGGEVASVQEASQSPGDATTFSRTAAAKVVVVRRGTPDATATYGLQAATDQYGRVATVTRKLGTGGITRRTIWDASYPIERKSVTDNDGGTPSRTVSYEYKPSSMGLVSRVIEPLDSTNSRWTDFTYNSNDDVTQRVVSRQGDATLSTTTRYCYSTVGCSASATDLLLRATVQNYTDGTPEAGHWADQDVTTGFEYDSHGQRTLERRFNYASDGTLRDQRAIAYEWDTFGNLSASIVNFADGDVDSHGVDIDPDATGARTDLTTSYVFDTAGNRIASADPRRAIEVAKRTSLGADDYVARSTFDALGRALTATLPTTPASLGGVACAPDPICRTTTSVLDERGGVLNVADPGGVVTATQFDAMGYATLTFEDVDGTDGTPAKVTSTTTYDAAGRVLTTKDRIQAASGATSGCTLHVYDELGRETDVTEGSNTAPCSNATGIASTTHRTFDALDRTTGETAGYGAAGAQATVTTYDLGGRATSVDDQFTCTTAVFDYRDLATETVQGRATGTCTGGTPVTTTITNDGLGRVVLRSVDSSNAPEANTFDAAGNALATSGKQGGVTTTSTYTLNPLDQVIVEIRSDGSTARTNYDATGNVTDRCYWNPTPSNGPIDCKPADSAWSSNPPTQAGTSAYDARNQRIQLTSRLGSSSTLATTTYDQDHNYQISRFYLPTHYNGSGLRDVEAQDLYHYDAQHRLDSVTHQQCAVTPGTDTCTGTVTETGKSTYGFDDNDNRTLVAESSTDWNLSTRTYCYDPLNRLTASRLTSNCASSPDETYTYDDAGNRKTATVAGATRIFTYGTDGQLDSCSAPTCTITYDAAGRLATITDSAVSWTFAYDADGKLISACKSTACTGAIDRVDYLYDGSGHRTQIKESDWDGTNTTVVATDLRYQGDTVVQESVGGTVMRTYATDDAGRIVEVCDPICETGTIYLVVYNGHGDASGLWRQNVDGSLTLANSYTYNTWGVPTTTVAPGSIDLKFRFLYVGAADVQWDSSFGLNLHYMHARHYSPSLGRFLQPDPARADGNLYAYAANSPVTKSDCRGLSPDCNKLKKAILAVAEEIVRRRDDLLEDRQMLPWFWKIWPLKGTITGHQQQFQNKQANLRKKLDDWQNDDCGGPGNGGRLPADVWEIVTWSTPSPRYRREPSPGRNYDLRWIGAGALAYTAYRAARAWGGWGRVPSFGSFGGWGGYGGGPLGGGGGRPALVR